MLSAFDTIRFAAIRLTLILIFFFVGAGGAAAESLLENSITALSKFLSGIGQSSKNQHVIRLRNDGQPFTLHILPSDHSAITVRLSPSTRYVEIFRGCRNDWCHVSFGRAAGWIRKDRLDLRPPAYGPYSPAGEPEEVELLAEPNAENAKPVAVANIPLPVRKGPLPPLAKPEPPEKAKPEVIQTAATAEPEFTAPEISAPRERPLNASLKVYDIEKKKYSLTRMENAMFLPVREDRSDDARILGVIPFFADDVEAAGLCVNQWCLVERGDTLRGWIRQDYLSDAPADGSPLLKLQAPSGLVTIPIYVEPNEASVIDAYLSAKTTDIQPEGACGIDWCRISHEGNTGWIQSQYLARQ